MTEHTPGPSKNQARDVLLFYLKTAWQAGGVKWTSDNDSEVSEIVDNLIAAAVSEARKEIFP